MHFHVYGPVSVRNNDLFTLNKSRINEKIRALQADCALQFVIYGDSAYAILWDSHIRARHQYENLSAREVLENRRLSSCREAIE